MLLTEAWMLSPLVALRPEPFGALAYHFGNRRLTFVKRPALVDVVKRLATEPDIRGALESARVPQQEWRAYEAALRNLADADVIRPRS